MTVHDDVYGVDPTTPERAWKDRLISRATQAVRQAQGRPAWDTLLQVTAPLIIGGQGGSATRLAAKVLAHASAVNLPEFDRSTYDSWSMRCSGLNHPGLIEELVRQAGSLDYSFDQLSDELCKELLAKGEAMCAQVKSEGRARTPTTLWGWKEPRTLYYLPLWQRIFPGFRFVHVVRDVRTIRSPHIEGEVSLQQAYFGEVQMEARENFERLWAATNLDVWGWAQRLIPGRYYLLNVEKLTGDERSRMSELLRLGEFIGTPIDTKRAMRLARPLRRVELKARSGLVGEALASLGYSS